MNIFQQARANEKEGSGYHAYRYKTIKLSRKNSWHHLSIRWGIRWSDNLQLFPIWNTSHNCQRALQFGIGKLYLEIAYCRKSAFNQDRWFPFRKRLWKFYQLVA